MQARLARLLLCDRSKSLKSKGDPAPALRPEAAAKAPKVTEALLPGDLQLRLLATSDLHAHLMPHDYYSGTVTNRLGLARTASLIASARAEVENCLLFDNGDFLHGSPLGDFIALSHGLQQGQIHPMVMAMNHLGYDAGTLGNHEFNYGLDFLTTALAGAEFPVVAANVFNNNGKTPATPFVPPYVILNRSVRDTSGVAHPLKIGVIGFTPPQIMLWDQHHLAGKLTTRDIVETATNAVPQMQQQGADLIIALSHAGIGLGHATGELENVSTALARIAGIDVVIAGHVHLVFPSDDFAHTADVDPVLGTLCGKPAVMPGFHGSHLGVIDLRLRLQAGRYKIHHHRAKVMPIWQRGADGREMAKVETDSALAELVSPAHIQTLNWVNRPIGQTPMPLNSFFALLTEAPALQLVAAAQAQHVETTLQSTPYAQLPILAAVAPFKAGGRGGPENYTDVPAGDVMLRNAADLYIYPNTSAAIRLSGAEIADWLDYAAGIFNQIVADDKDAPLINPDFPSFNFDMIFGLRFQIDLGKPPRFDLRGTLINPNSRRIVDLRYNDRPLDPLAEFAVATNSHRIAANAGFLRPGSLQILFQSPDTNLDVVRRYFASAAEKRFGPSLNRRFLAMPGTTVTFDTSPKALAHVSDVAPLQIEPLCQLPNGFMRFRLHL